MEIDRRTLLSMAALTGTAFGGASLTLPGVAFGQGTSNIRQFRASLGSSVLASGVCFFWLGMHRKLNYYLEEGLIAQWRGVQNQTQALALIANQSQEMGGVGPSTLMGLAAKGTKVPLQVAYAHYQRNPWRVAVASDSDFKSWEDLRGKNVGLISLGQLSTKWYAEAAAREAGLDPVKDIKFVPIGVNAPAGVALKNGNVAAYVSHSIHTTRLGRLGFDIRLLPEPSFAGDNSFDGGMTVNTDFMNDKTNRQALGSFMRAIAKGSVFSLENPRAAIKIHYDLFPAALPKGKAYEKSVDAAVLELEKNLENIRVDNTEHKQHGMMSQKKWETVAYKWMGFSRDQIPDVGAFYTNELIEEANDFDVEAVRQQAREFKL